MTTFADLIADDLTLVADDLRPITLHLPQGIAGDPTEVASALRRAITKTEAERSKGKYTQDDVTFRLKVSDGTPIMGGRIEDADGNVWNIIEVNKVTSATCWRCFCRLSQVVEAGTDTLVTIKKRTSTKAPEGDSVWTYSVIKSHVRARIQQIGAAREFSKGMRTNNLTARIMFHEQYLMDENYRIEDVDGTAYDFVSDDGRDSITGLYVVTAEQPQF